MCQHLTPLPSIGLAGPAQAPLAWSLYGLMLGALVFHYVFSLRRIEPMRRRRLALGLYLLGDICWLGFVVLFFDILLPVTGALDRWYSLQLSGALTSDHCYQMIQSLYTSEDGILNLVLIGGIACMVAALALFLITHKRYIHAV